MKPAITVVIAICLAVTVTSVASAAPILSAVSTSLGGGLLAWDIFFDANDGLNASAAIDLKFDGFEMTMQQKGPAVVPSLLVNTLDDIETFWALGPDVVADSYMYKGSSPSAGLSGVWSYNLPTGIDNPNGAVGGVFGTNFNGDPMWISAGTAPGTAINSEQVAHLVYDTTGGGIFASPRVFGRMARLGVVYDLPESGLVFVIPEPSSIIMLTIGACALFGFGRRRRRSSRQ